MRNKIDFLKLYKGALVFTIIGLVLLIGAVIGAPIIVRVLDNTVENLQIVQFLKQFRLWGGIIGWIIFILGLFYPQLRFQKVMMDFLLLRITEEKWHGYVDKLLAKLKGMGEVKAILILHRHYHFRETDYEKLNPVLHEMLNRFSGNAGLRGTAYAILAEGAFAENDLEKFEDYGRNAYNYYTQLAAKKKFKTQAEGCAVEIAAMKYMLTGEYQTALQVIDKMLAQNLEPLNRVVLTDKYLECQQRQGSPLREDYLSFMNAQPDMADTKKWKQIYRERSA